MSTQEYVETIKSEVQMQNEYAYSAAFDFSKYDSSSEDEAKPKHTRKRSRRCLEPTSSASLAAPTFHELHSVETSSSSIDLDFIIYGHPCVLHEDSNGFAKELEDEKNLIDVLDTDYSDHEIAYVSSSLFDEKSKLNINDSSSMHLYVDKYDVRTLMTREDLLLLNEDTYGKNEEWDDDLTFEERKELEELRFGDMYISCSSIIIRHQENDDSKDENVKRKSKKISSLEGNIEIAKVQTKNELSIATASDKKDEVYDSDVVFDLEARIRSIIPANIPIPTTKRQYDIIQMTAKKSCDQPQFELFLKVKEETNPEFQFLSQKNVLHPFYLALKKSLETKADKQSEARGKAIGLLDMYSSSSSDEENEQESHSDDKIIKEEVSAIVQSNTDDSNKLSKEEKRAIRLKKAKLLRHRFQQS